MNYDCTKLLKLREDRGMSREALCIELAKKNYRVSLNSIRNWEKGFSNPSYTSLCHLAEYFGKKIEYFFNPRIY